ncbi:hypothetical protein [Aquabacter cavernae]|uniref:hypothetical protein n=1 Tax=Aquabacter cavernae TaxID=2496029 RepID=UPI000F8CC838|nr:hypothetical protein [Aquabacter cavernae]
MGSPGSGPASALPPASAPGQGRLLRALAVGGAGFVVLLLLAGAGLLWVRNGTTVFFETLSAGLAACF